MKIKISKATIIRVLVLLFGLINAMLLMAGKSPIDINDAMISETVEVIYQAASYILLIWSALWAAWKNNSFTKAAIRADNCKATGAFDDPLPGESE